MAVNRCLQTQDNLAEEQFILAEFDGISVPSSVAQQDVEDVAAVLAGPLAGSALDRMPSCSHGREERRLVARLRAVWEGE